MLGRGFACASFALAVVVLSAVDVGAATRDGSLPAGQAPAPAGFPGSSGPPSEAIEASRVREARLRESWQTTAAKEERRQGRRRFKDLSRGEARALAEREHPSVFSPEVWAPLRGVRRRGEFLDPYSARVTLPNGTNAVAVSSLPLLARDNSGSQSAVDLDLVGSGDLRPENPFAFDTAAQPGGEHRVDVRAVDQLGHESIQTFSFRTACCLGAARSWATALGALDVGFGDVNGDCFADLVTRDRLTAELKVGLSNGTGFAALAPWGNWPGAGRLAPLRLADVDGDLLEDLVVRDAPTDSVYVARSTGAAFAAPSLWGNVSAGPEFTAADANGDGSADAVGRDPVTGAVRVGGSAFFEGEGEARFDTATAWLAAVAGELRSGDADGDGASDIISREQSGQLRVTPSSTMDFAGGGVWGSLPTDHELVTGDVDGDGTVDAVGRSSTNSDVRVAASTATAFEPSERVGTFSSAYTVDLADANGDGREDVLGRNPLTGDVAVALSGVPGVPGPDAGDWTPDPEIAYDDATDLLFDNPSGGTAAAAAPAPARMQLGFEDPARLLFRMNLGTPGDPFDGGEGERLANARIDLIYSRIRAAGARMVRFNVYWGAYENADGSFEFAKLGKAVDRARANGMRVYVSLGGLTAPGGECLKVGPGRVLPYNDRARTCTDDPAHNVCGAPGTAPAQQTEATGVAPDPGCYARFVRAAVAYLGERVNAYSIWNEPNVRTFLRTADPRSQRVVPADLYRELYVQGRVPPSRPPTPTRR